MKFHRCCSPLEKNASDAHVPVLPVVAIEVEGDSHPRERTDDLYRRHRITGPWRELCLHLLQKSRVWKQLFI